MRLIAIVVLFLLNIGCRKKDSSTNTPVPTQTSTNLLDTSYGSLRMNINNLEWIGGITTNINNERFTIHANKFLIISEVLIPVEFMSLYLIEKNLLKQRLYKTDSLLNINPQLSKSCASFNTNKDDGGVLCSLYNVIEDDSINNYFQITHQINNYSEIWGNFHISFKREINCTSNPYQDTLIISQGRFHAILKK